MLGRIIAYAYGAFTLGCAFIGAAIDSGYWRKDSREDIEELKRASDKLWSLSHTTSEYAHGFVTLDKGLQLHYLHPAKDRASAKVRKLVILLHGFPDSCHNFATYLRPGVTTDTDELRVSLDIPGYGGSDSLVSYHANDVLDAIAEGIVKLKELYLPSPASTDEQSECLLVGHDWGGAITYRIAAETVGLADRVIVINSTYTPHARENISNRVKAAYHAWTRWTQAPQSLSLLAPAYHQLAPILTQLIMSGYIFMFNLPFRTATWAPGLVLHLVKWVITKGHYREHDTISPTDFALALSSCLGPTAAECSTHLPNGSTYGRSVLDRSLTKSPGDWDERIRLYREGLATARWKANDFNSKFLVKNEDDEPSPSEKRPAKELRHFQCPVTIIYGLKDLALDPRIMLDGIERYFAPSEGRLGRDIRGGQSEVIRLKECGHWSLIEKEGIETLEAVLRR